MARDTDRKIISEALRLQKLWRVEDRVRFNGQLRVDLITDYDERLVLWYGKAEQLTMGTYTHWDRETGDITCREGFTRRKRERILKLINQKDVNE